MHSLMISGRFEILGELGHGAMGRVLLAQDRELQRQVALKQLLPSGHWRQRAHFEDGARSESLRTVEAR